MRQHSVISMGISEKTLLIYSNVIIRGNSYLCITTKEGA